MSANNKPVILVVDDQTTVVRVMGRILADNYVVHVATDGERALQIAEERQPDLILLDMVMPGMSGIEVCQKLKANPATAQIPVIFVTSMDDKHHEASGFKAGAVDYISKPPSDEIVNARVSVHLVLNRQARFIEMLARGELGANSDIIASARALLDR
ncbi:MAG: response regulator [Pseudomonadales bacterium]|nr:response regulator [Pseudomonadales bacterium]